MVSFIMAPIILFILAICLFVLPIVLPGANPISTEAQYTIFSFLIVAGVYFMIWPKIRKQDLDAIETLPGALEEVRKLGREYYRNTSAIQENSTAVKQLADEILQIKKPLDELLIERRQELMNVKSELTEWQKMAIRYYEYLYRSSNLDGIDDMQHQTYQKAANDYRRELKPLGFEVIEPKTGEAFDEDFHECRGEVASEDFSPGEIVSIEGVGICLHGRIHKPAPVIIAAKKAMQTTSEYPVTPLTEISEIDEITEVTEISEMDEITKMAEVAEVQQLAAAPTPEKTETTNTDTETSQ